MKNNLLSNVVLVGFGRMATIIIQFVTTIFLARLLMPEDFGIVAMCTIFMNISNVLIDSGMGGSIIYHKDTTEKDYHTIFWFNLLISIFLYSILFCSSGYIASFYKVPILKTLIQVSGLSIIIHSCCIIQSTLLSKNLKFGIQTRILVSSSILTSLVVIALAYCGMGIWALAAQTLLLNVFQAILFILNGHYFPKFYFSFPLLKKHWNFGSKLLFVSLLKMVYDNIYVQLIGKAVTIKDAGYYNQAKRLNDVPMNVIQMPLDRVIFPSLNHIDNFKEKTVTILEMFSLILIPLLTFGSLVAPIIVIVLFGEKWSASGWMLSFMFIGTIGASLENLNRSFIKATGKMSILLKYDVAKRIINILIVILSLKWGIKGVLCAFILNGFLGWIINCFALYRINGSSIYLQIKAVVQVFVISIIAFICAYLVKEIFEYNMILSFILQTIVYLSVLSLLFLLLQRKRIVDSINLIRKNTK